jgi:hypothetical protein
MAEPGNMNVVSAILDLKDRAPFVPFNIVLTSGDKYRIENGDSLVEMKTEFFYARSGGDSFVFLRKTEIVAVERPEGGTKRTARRKAS